MILPHGQKVPAWGLFKGVQAVSNYRLHINTTISYYLGVKEWHRLQRSLLSGCTSLKLEVLRALYCTEIHCTVLYYPTIHFAVLLCSSLYRLVLLQVNCTVLYYNELFLIAHYSILVYIAIALPCSHFNFIALFLILCSALYQIYVFSLYCTVHLVLFHIVLHCYVISIIAYVEYNSIKQ